MTQIAVVYQISVQTVLDKNLVTKFHFSSIVTIAFGFDFDVSSHHGSQIQFTSGASTSLA
jgi:hypothetical protein